MSYQGETCTSRISLLATLRTSIVYHANSLEIGTFANSCAIWSHGILEVLCQHQANTSSFQVNEQEIVARRCQQMLWHCCTLLHEILPSLLDLLDFLSSTFWRMLQEKVIPIRQSLQENHEGTCEHNGQNYIQYQAKLPHWSGRKRNDIQISLARSSFLRKSNDSCCNRKRCGIAYYLRGTATYAAILYHFHCWEKVLYHEASKVETFAFRYWWSSIANFP